MATKPRRRKPGRPSFNPTRPMRLSIERMCAVGDSHDTIARALGIDANTLRKHFAEELATGAARRRRQVVDLVFSGAESGNATLIKRAEEMTRAAAADIGEQAPATAATQRSPRPGKREVQHREALEAGKGGDWGEDLAPLPTGSRLN